MVGDQEALKKTEIESQQSQKTESTDQVRPLP
jgi:hypothetical protein